MGRWILGGAACAAVAVTLTSCGAGTSPGTYVGDDAVTAVAQELAAEGAVAYFLGGSADGLTTSYGTCRPAMFEEGAAWIR